MERISASDTNVTFPPIPLKCMVHGKQLKAKIVEEIANPVQWMLRIEFSNGADVIAVCLENSGWVADDHIFSGYIRSIRHHLDDFLAVKNFEWDTFEVDHNQKVEKIWISKRNTEEHGDHFDVHYGGCYQFSLQKRNNVWSIISKCVLPQIISEDLAALIATQIDAKF